MQVRDQLATMDAQQLRDFAAELIEKIIRQDGEISGKDGMKEAADLVKKQKVMQGTW